MTHPFDAAVRLEPAGEHLFTGATSPAYTNMVGPFGGISGAALLNAAMCHPQRQGEPISITVNFAGPIADGAFDIETQPLRSNRSTQHWLMQLRQDGEVCATSTAVFAQRRETWSACEAAAPQDVPPPHSLARSAVEGRKPWVRRYDMRFVEGAVPWGMDGQEQGRSDSLLWVRDEPPRPIDHLSLVAICDSFFPRIFLRRGKLTPMATVSLTCYFHADAALLAAQSDRHVIGAARALNYLKGYYDQTAEIWSDQGQLLASTTQMVYYKE